MRYVKPQMEVISVRLEDIILTSNPGTVIPGGNTGQGTGNDTGVGDGSGQWP
jgi:hypothetical protein